MKLYMVSNPQKQTIKAVDESGFHAAIETFESMGYSVNIVSTETPETVVDGEATASSNITIVTAFIWEA